MNPPSLIFHFHLKDYPLMKVKVINDLHYHTIPNTDKPKVLLIHGLVGSSRIFFPLMQELFTMGFEPWAINLKGHGINPSYDLSNTHINDYLEEVKDSIKALKPSILIGHSMGGILAQKAAIQNSSIKQLILFCSVPSFDIRMRIPNKGLMLWYSIKYLYRVFCGDYLKTLKKKIAKALMQKTTHPKTLENWNTAMKEDHEQNKESPHIIKDLLKGDIRKIDFDSLKIHFKTFVFSGKYDALIPFSTQKKLAHHYNAHYVNLLHSGHLLLIEDDFYSFIDEIKKFLAP